MTRDSKINEEIQKHLYAEDHDFNLDLLSLNAYKALSEEERKVYAKNSRGS